MDARRYRVTTLLCAIAIGGYCAGSERATLETVRELVARNEALINPIKMAYTVRKTRTGELAHRVGGVRKLGRRYSHINYVWAQSGEIHYARVDSFYGLNEPAGSTAYIFDRRSKTRAALPDLMEGTISSRDTYDWYKVMVAKLGLRPFEGSCKLSEILVPEHASLRRETETVDGRETYVIDARRPSIHPYFARIWIDRERAMPLRIRYFDRHPDWGDAEKMSEITDIKLHRLPNGGWIPIRGVRSINRRDGAISYEHITVDVNSVTIRREDIPDSLFRFDFPDGASIYNAVSGLTTVEGRPLKTYEQVAAMGGRFIAGTIVDDFGSPVPGVVVSPSAVRTQQSDGRFRLRLIQIHDRSCAITDSKGRFAIDLEQEGSYDIWIFPEDFVDVKFRDVPLGKHDLKVTLSKGGAITGRVVRLTAGGNVPVVNAEVTAKEGDQRSTATPRRNRMQTKTDSQGRFKIKYLDTLMSKRLTDGSGKYQRVPRLWQIVCGPVSESVLFNEEKVSQEVELVLKPELRDACPLIGRALPRFENIKINLAADQTTDKMILICFFDMQQRPSRNCVLQLARESERLAKKGVSLAAVQAVRTDENALVEWVKESNIPFPIGAIQKNEQSCRFDWAVRSLPWLILTDRQHVVRAEGFRLSALEQKIKAGR